MNERIKELAKQAKAFIVDPMHAKLGGVDEVGFSKYSDLEKFAELLIRECMDVVLDKDGKEWAGYVHVCREESADMIKKHFGVE